MDNIILKALRKEPERRYSSVERFSDDLRRHLEGLPVSARPDTFSYRAEKFIKRNRSAVLGGMLVFLSLFGGIIGISWQYLRAERERKSAEQRFNQVRQLANNVVFKYHDAIRDLPGSTKAREMLVEDATSYLDNLSLETSDNAELEYELARAYFKIGDVQGEVFNANLGNSDNAIRSYRKSVSLLENLIEKNPEKLSFQGDLQREYNALALVLLRQQLWEQGNEIVLKNVALGENLTKREPQNVEYLFGFFRSRIVLGDARKFINGYQSQTQTYRETVGLIEGQSPEIKNNSKFLLVKAALLQRLGSALEDWGEALEEQNAPAGDIQSKFKEAIETHRRSLQAVEELEKRDSTDARYRRSRGSVLMNVGSALSRAGFNGEGILFLKSALDRMSEVSKADVSNIEAQRDVAEAFQYLAMGYARNNEFEKALDDYRNSLEILDKVTLQDPKNVEFLEQQHLIYNSIGDIYLIEKRFPEALKAYQSGLSFTEKMSALLASEETLLLQSESLKKIGDFYKQESSLKNAEKSTEFYRQALTILRQLEKQNRLSKNKEYKINLLTKEAALN